MENKEYKEWEEKVEKTKIENRELIGDFKIYLESKSLNPKTIMRHINNIDFYVNGYLLRYEDIFPAEKGFDQIGSFLGDYFIRTAMWATEATIKENISSFKKFYNYLNEIGKVHPDDLNEMKEIIKEEKEEWFRRVKLF